jgi:hypothetical protein
MRQIQRGNSPAETRLTDEEMDDFVTSRVLRCLCGRGLGQGDYDDAEDGVMEAADLQDAAMFPGLHG